VDEEDDDDDEEEEEEEEALLDDRLRLRARGRARSRSRSSASAYISTRDEVWRSGRRYSCIFSVPGLDRPSASSVRLLRYSLHRPASLGFTRSSAPERKKRID